jgi:hypothetical protein
MCQSIKKKKPAERNRKKQIERSKQQDLKAKSWSVRA